MYTYDYLIVGSGLFGSVFAYEATKRGKKCLVIDKRTHSGGNIYCENIEGINIHKYGPHIFHTNDETIWNYVNQLVRFNRFTYSPLANYGGSLYNLPFNMNTFYKLWGVKDPQSAKDIIDNQISKYNYPNPANLEEQALSLVGDDIYHKLIKGYTEKQWGRPAHLLPAFIIKRLPLRYTFDNNYFNDKFQGIPIGGYNKLIEELLINIEVKLNVNYFDDRMYYNDLARKVVYSGPLDEFYNYQFGLLEYRSLNFEHKTIEVENYQGNAAINFTSIDVPYTRIIEHKHFEFGNQKHTVITYEFPMNWVKGRDAYYPINDSANNEIFNKYKQLSDIETKFIFGGRLAEYKYYDMHQVIASALKRVKLEFMN